MTNITSWHTVARKGIISPVFADNPAKRHTERDSKKAVFRGLSAPASLKQAAGVSDKSAKLGFPGPIGPGLIEA